MPTISVVIPHSGKDDYLIEAVRSVMLQTVLPSETLIILDGVNLGEAASVELSKYKHLKIISIRKSGVSAARNEGIRLATSEWIAFLDSDDLWDTHKLELQMPFLKENVSFVHGNAYIFFENDLSHFEVVAPQAQPTFYNLLIGVYAVSGSSSSVVVKRSKLINVGLFDFSMQVAEDWDLWVRLAKEGTIVHNPLAISYIRSHQQSSQAKLYWNTKLTHKNSDFFSMCRIYEKHTDIRNRQLDSQVRELFIERISWEILKMWRKPGKILFAIPRIGKSEQPIIWNQLFPTNSKYVLWAIQFSTKKMTIVVINQVKSLINILKSFK